ncbi:hypothetical protein PRK78_006819 [Emydomyces testavorans]|uniref:Uncharacterized protein n=1 Tax=Emydomyces testavorans TaxID=2070801 RepID=A0AAF0DM57_9EURO|nr:hypothetical protein PRK78_006819 [Emydomyces testavorans]
MDARTDTGFEFWASLLNARGDLAGKFWLGAVALEVGQSRAAIGAESIGETSVLRGARPEQDETPAKTYRARWDGWELGTREADSGEKNKDLGELHFVLRNDKIKLNCCRMTGMFERILDLFSTKRAVSRYKKERENHEIWGDVEWDFIVLPDLPSGS